MNNTLREVSNESQVKMKRQDDELQRKVIQLQYKQEGIDTLQTTLNQYREKCRYLEEELGQREAVVKHLKV